MLFTISFYFYFQWHFYLVWFLTSSSFSLYSFFYFTILLSVFFYLCFGSLPIYYLFCLSTIYYLLSIGDFTKWFELQFYSRSGFGNSFFMNLVCRFFSFFAFIFFYIFRIWVMICLYIVFLYITINIVIIFNKSFWFFFRMSMSILIANVSMLISSVYCSTTLLSASMLLLNLVFRQSLYLMDNFTKPSFCHKYCRGFNPWWL